MPATPGAAALRHAPPGPGARPRLLTPGFTALLVAQAGFGYAFSSFFLLPKYLVTQLAADATRIGLVTIAHNAVTVLTIPAMGAIVDRHGRREFLTAGALVMAVAALCFTAVDSVGPLLYGLRMVQGLAFAMAFTAGAALAVDEAPPERLAEAIGLFGLTFLSMNAIAPAVGEEIAARAGWSAAFGGAAAGALLCALLSRRLRERPRAAEADPTTLLQVATRPSLLPILAVISLIGAAMCSMFTYHQPYALGLGIENVRGFFVAYALVAVFVRVAFGQAADRLGRRRVSLGALVLYTLVVPATAWLAHAPLALFGGALGAAHGVFYPAFNAVAIEESRASERGRVMALFQAGFQLGFGAGGLALGVLADARGYPAVFWAGGACVLAALLLLAWDGRRRSRGS
jgi:predicted MFS family arabinose efflux permease